LSCGDRPDAIAFPASSASDMAEIDRIDTIPT
jgi:hypothetical protein